MAGRKPTDFVLRPSALGTEEFYHQTLSENYRLTIDSIAEYVDNYIGGDTPVANGTRLSSGGKVIWQSGLTFLVTSAVYYINGVRFESDEQTHTLDAADPTNPRFDRFYLDVDGLFGAVTGTPAADPLAPTIDPTTQISLTIAEVAAAATTPSNITGDIIYDENVGVAGGEWDTSATVPLNVDFASTDDPSTNTVRIKTTGASETPNVLNFTVAAPLTISNYEFLVLDIKQEARIGADVFIQFFWVDTTGGGVICSRTLYGGQFGFNPGTSGWQTVAIDIAAFLPVTESIEANQLQIAISSSAAAYQWGFDNIFLQGGLEPQQQPYDFYTHKNTIWVDGNGSDETGKRGRFDEPFRTVKEAERVAVAGDTIIVMPGTYNEDNLGAADVTYYLSSGTIIIGTPAKNVFTDNNIAKTVRVLGEGEIQTSNGRLLYIRNAASVFYVSASIMRQTSFSTSLDPIVSYGTLYLDVSHQLLNNADNWYLFNMYPGSKTYFRGNFISSRCRVVNNRGLFYYSHNYTEVFNTNAFECAIGSNDPAAYFRMTGGVLRIDNGSSTWTGGLAPEAGILSFEGVRIEGTCDVRPMIDVGHVTPDGGLAMVELNNCSVEVEASANLPIAIVRNAADLKLIARNTEFINNNTGSISGGIQIERSDANGNVELTNCVIRLNSTAVGAGAKAIRDNASGTIYYKMFTDTLSNGAFDGTNLISSTIGVVDANAKSD